MIHLIRRLPILLALSLTLLSPVHAKLYKYTALHMKSYDKMKLLVEKQIQLSQAELERTDINEDEREGLAVIPLKEALRLIFSRPDKDQMVGKLYPLVSKRLDALHSLDLALSGLTAEAIVGIKKDKLNENHRSTFLFILENILVEFRPQLNSASIQGIFKQIRDAKIVVPKSIISYRKLNGMYQSTSPSKVAEALLKPYEEKKK